MNGPLKQRLVGAGVLIAVAVIVIPALLDGSGRTPGEDAYFRLPAAPEIVTSRLRRPPPTEEGSPIASSAGGTMQDGMPEERERRSALKPLSAAEQSKVHREGEGEVMTMGGPKGPSAWVVQVGSFAERGNAIRLRDHLRKAGFAAFTETTRGPRGVFFRVRVGPEQRRERALTLANRLKKEQGRSGEVVRYP